MIASMPLEVIFVMLMGLAVLVYVILDGYDLGLGVGIVFLKPETQQRALKTIGPFWDANETWLVLGVGILLAAFPGAHSAILQNLYIPVLVMLCGLIGRAFFYEMSLKFPHKKQFIWLFFLGSVITALSQGWMIAQYAGGFETHWAFSLWCAVCLALAYLWLGFLWVNARISLDDSESKRVYTLIKIGAIGSAMGLALISILSPLYFEQVFERWFGVDPVSGQSKMFYLWIYPAMTTYFWLRAVTSYKKNPWHGFLYAVAVFCLSFFGLAYGTYPYIAPGQMTLFEAAASPVTLEIIFWGFVLVMPFILAYTVFIHYWFLRRKDV